jgi:hypothetical protein
MLVERTGKIDQVDRSSDADYWQLQGDEAIVRAEELPFEAAWSRRADMVLAGLTVPVSGLDDLIVTKRAAGRPGLFHRYPQTGRTAAASVNRPLAGFTVPTQIGRRATASICGRATE